MKKCNRCAYCCTFAKIRLPANDDTARWLEYHGCRTKTIGDKLWVIIPTLCKYLNRIDGQYTCTIYDNRPQVCKEYFCNESRVDGTAGKGVNPDY